VLRTIDPDGRTVFWPAGNTPQTVAYRRASRTDRKTADIPFEELIALARTLDLDNLFDPPQQQSDGWFPLAWRPLGGQEVFTALTSAG
jgi:hypothetical protein